MPIYQKLVIFFNIMSIWYLQAGLNYKWLVWFTIQAYFDCLGKILNLTTIKQCMAFFDELSVGGNAA